MKYDSDFEVRLATLAALGGDTSIPYDSVYSIDLAILEAVQGGGGGEGLNYNQIKALLAASGITEIKVNGSTSAITLDYDLLSQIGQGSGIDWNEVKQDLANSGVTSILFDNGSGVTEALDYDKVMQIGQGGEQDYVCVESIDALSGITDPKDGMVAFVQAHTAQEQKLVVVADYYSTSDNEDPLYINVEWNDGNSALLIERYGGNNIYINNDYGQFVGLGSSFDDIHNRRSLIPIRIDFNNGATATLVSNTYGSHYPDYWETVNTFYFDKFDGAFPTITFSHDSGNVVVVASSATVETVTVPYPAKGFWQYDAINEMWHAIEIYFDNITSEEFQTIASDFVTNTHNMTILRNVQWWSGKTVIRFDTIKNRSTHIGAQSNPFIGNNSDVSFLRFDIIYSEDENKWYCQDVQETNTTNWGEINTKFKSKIESVSEQDDYTWRDGKLYNVMVNEDVSGSVYDLTISIDTSATDDVIVADNITNGYGWQNMGLQTNLAYGYIKVLSYQIYIYKSTNPDWQVINYAMINDDNNGTSKTALVAVKCIDNGDDTFTIKVFVGNNGYNYYNFNTYNDHSYVWNETTGQTIHFDPHSYFVGVSPDNIIYHRSLICNDGVRMYDNSQKKIRVMTVAEYENLPVKDDNIIYYLTEN